MAVQFQVAHSRLVRGAGVIAGGPYGCARGSLWRALRNCMSPSSWFPLPPGVQTRSTIETLAAAGRIDPIAHLRDDRVWLLSGGADRTVERPVMDRLAEFYGEWLEPSAIRYLKPDDAGHALPSAVDPDANECPSSEPPFINRCRDPDGPGRFDAAGKILAHLLPGARPPAATAAGELIEFDQRPHVAGRPIDASLADRGLAYVPADCRRGGCRIHVVFHGCRQNAETLGRRFVDGAGYHRWADSNRLIVLYPQTAARSGLVAGSWSWIHNPRACWDWWGYSGPDYATRDGVQVRAVKSMIDRLGEARRR